MKIATTVLAGDAYARGATQGAALRPRIQAHLATWLEALAAAGLGEPRAYVADLLHDTDFLSAIARHTPDLFEEVRGLAVGAEVPQDLIFALQLLDEEWAYRARRLAGGGKLQKCSSIAVALPSGPTLIGQNMDLGGYTDGHQALLQIEGAAAAPSALVFTLAGIIGLMGVNAAGVGVCVNSLPQLPSASEGLPVAFVVRRLLQATSLPEAAELVLTLPHATNQHYVIAEAGAVRSFEACAAGVAEFRPSDPTRVLHTNHPLGEEPGAPEPPSARENTEARLASLVRRLSTGRPGVEDVRAALSSFDDPRHPVCRLRKPDGGLTSFTTGSMVSVLRPAPAPVESWVSAGPPSLGGYAEFNLAVAAA